MSRQSPLMSVGSRGVVSSSLLQCPENTVLGDMKVIWPIKPMPLITKCSVLEQVEEENQQELANLD